MQNEQIKSLIQGALEADVNIEGDGCNFSVTIITDQFAGLSKLKRQQRVYQLLNPYIESGEVHAVSMTTYTHQEWEEKNG